MRLWVRTVLATGAGFTGAVIFLGLFAAHG
jgi:hypothetical protein